LSRWEQGGSMTGEARGEKGRKWKRRKGCKRQGWDWDEVCVTAAGFDSNGAEDEGEARMSKGMRVARLRGKNTVGHGGYLHQSSRAINAAETRLRP
jgi:hypothetical protein